MGSSARARGEDRARPRFDGVPGPRDFADPGTAPRNPSRRKPNKNLPYERASRSLLSPIRGAIDVFCPKQSYDIARHHRRTWVDSVALRDRTFGFGLFERPATFAPFIKRGPGFARACRRRGRAGRPGLADVGAHGPFGES